MRPKFAAFESDARDDEVFGSVKTHTFEAKAVFHIRIDRYSVFMDQDGADIAIEMEWQDRVPPYRKDHRLFLDEFAELEFVVADLSYKVNLQAKPEEFFKIFNRTHHVDRSR
jgi:hypothetical protein